MKNLMKLSVVLVAAALAFSSCNCFKKMAKNRDDIKLTVTPEILTLNNGTVAADINVTFPVEYFNKKPSSKLLPSSYSKAAKWPAPPNTTRVRR